MLRIRPRRLRQVTVVLAAVITMAFVVAGLTVSATTSPGAPLVAHGGRSLVGVGLLLGAVALTPLRIRAAADAGEIRVRNLVSDVDLPWTSVRAVRYPHGLPWASLLLVSGDVVSVLAVQISDGSRAVEAVRRLRELHAAAAAQTADRR